MIGYIGGIWIKNAKWLKRVNYICGRMILPTWVEKAPKAKAAIFVTCL